MNNPITVSATIDADITKVWAYYTHPEHIINWNFADSSWHCPKAENDMQIGGKYLARMEAKDGSFGFDFEAYYTEINNGQSFSYEFGGRMACVELIDNGPQTDIIVKFEPENENPVELQQAGWQSILNNFKSYTEQNP